MDYFRDRFTRDSCLQQYLHLLMITKICKKGPYYSSLLYGKKTDTPGACMIVEPAALIHLFIFIFCALGRLFPWMFWSPCGQFQSMYFFYFFYFIYTEYQRASLQRHPFNMSPLSDVLSITTHTQCRWIWILDTWQKNNACVRSKIIIIMPPSSAPQYVVLQRKIGPILSNAVAWTR